MEHELRERGMAERVLVEVEGERIAAVTEGADPSAGATRLPGVTIPGLANGHSHAFHRALRGRTHTLYSAVAIVRDGTMLHECIAVARLTMRSFSDEFLERYLDEAGQAVTASVGAYQLERTGIHLFDRIEGDHFTILGLPLLGLLAFFRQRGFVA